MSLSEEELRKIIEEGEKEGVKVEVSARSFATKSITLCPSFRLPTTGQGFELQIRASDGKRFGFASTCGAGNWRDCLKRAIKLMKLNKELEGELKPVEAQRYPRNPFPCFEMSESEILSSAEELLNACGEDIQRVRVEWEKAEVSFANPNLIEIDSASSCSCSANIRVGDASVWEAKSSRRKLKGREIERIAEKARELAALFKKRKSIPSSTYPMFLDYFAASSFFSIVAPCFCADRVQRKSSYFFDKVNKEVGSELLSIVDDGRWDKGLMSYKFDAEGCAMQRKVLMENGVVKGFLYDNYSALKEGKESTGNCASLSCVPSIGVTNFIILPGGWGMEEMMREIKKGLLIYSLRGVHACADPYSGDFSLGIDIAFYVENGEIKHGIEGGMICGNLFEAIRDLQAIGKEMRQESEIATPPILLKAKFISNEFV